MTLVGSATFAEPTREGLYFDQVVQASHNPLGLQAISKFFYRLPVFNDPGLLWESTKLDVGVQNNLSPSFDLIGVFAKLEPIAFFDIAVAVQFAGYYNLFGYGFYELPTYSSPSDPNEMSRSDTQNAAGFAFSVAPTLKAAFDPIVISNTFTLSYFYADNGQGYFFERIGNVALRKSDIELINSAYLLVNPFEGFYAGLNDWTIFVPGSGYVSHRLCAVGAYTAHLTQSLALYGGLFLGTFLNDQYFQYEFYTGAQIGMTLRL